MTTRVAELRPMIPAVVVQEASGQSDIASLEATARASRIAADAGTAQRIAGLLDGFVADMFSLVEAYQARTRDTQCAGLERDATSRSRAAREAHDGRVAETEKAVVDRARAAESSTVGDVFRVIGSAISLAVGALGAIFTGGATLVAAIAVAVAVLGPLVMNELAHAGVVEPEVAAAVGLGIAAVCTCVSLGCSAASLAGAAVGTALVVVDAATKAAIEVTTNVASIVAGLADVAGGGAAVGTAVLDRDAAEHEITATERAQRRDAERELEETAIDQLTELLAAFGRVAATLAETREEGTRTSRVALTFA